jgi:hypothetical protein
LHSGQSFGAKPVDCGPHIGHTVRIGIIDRNTGLIQGLHRPCTDACYNDGPNPGICQQRYRLKAATGSMRRIFKDLNPGDLILLNIHHGEQGTMAEMIGAGTVDSSGQL